MSEGTKREMSAAQTESNFALLLFHSPCQWFGWCSPALVRAISLFSLPIQMLETLSEIHPEIMFHWLSGHP